MNTNDYFYESVPDGIINAVMELDDTIDCCNQDGYELLAMTFGDTVSGDVLKSAGDDSFAEFAKNMQKLFELSYRPTVEDAKWIIGRALTQWGG